MTQKDKEEFEKLVPLIRELIRLNRIKERLKRGSSDFQLTPDGVIESVRTMCST